MTKVKVTKKATQEFVKFKLSTDAVWAKKALIAIYDNQTDDEVNNMCTSSLNGIGFTGADAEILTSFALQLQRRGSLSVKQMEILMKKIKKYWKQIIAISDESKLTNMVAAYAAA